uniref:Uncharacterized protein n=1 Tax=Candidatus Kentrum sp. LFY TaxID=2126342 RepID=A0A450WPQ3_9GAMM|nr:MAG: hypothetical protein BECKLFY1418C_GA0070996_105218 [Candidatus Kentron sp. LFY]
MHQIDTAFSTPAPEKRANDLGCPTPPIAESKTEVEAPKNACILMMIKAYLAYPEFPARFYSRIGKTKILGDPVPESEPIPFGFRREAPTNDISERAAFGFMSRISRITHK